MFTLKDDPQGDGNSMSLMINTLSLCLLTFVLLLYSVILRKRNLPPGPIQWPIVGNLFSLGSLPHRRLEELSLKYGPIMSMKLGSRLAVIVSSSEIVQELFTSHDQACASRPMTISASIVTNGGKSIGFSPYGAYWRKVKKLVNVHLLNKNRVMAFLPIRMKAVESMVNSISREANINHGVAEIRPYLIQTTMNIIMSMVSGNTYAFASLGEPEKSGDEFMDVIRETFLLLGGFNYADYIPFFAPIDFQHIAQRSRVVRETFDEMFGKLIDERVESRRKSVEILPMKMGTVVNGYDSQRSGDEPCQDLLKTQKKDFLDILLEMDEDERLSRSETIAIFQSMIIAGTDTSAVTTEWALAELICHPEKMKLLRDELKGIEISPETDFSQLPFLQAVIKETLRLHNTEPLLIPHKTIESIKMQGYDIPADTIIYINAWAISHNPNLWSEPTEFRPERFLGRNVDVRGQDFRLLPFGFGRRLCPGINLGLSMVEIMLAALVKRFDWKPIDGASSLVMTEEYSLTLRLAKPLIANVSELV